MKKSFLHCLIIFILSVIIISSICICTGCQSNAYSRLGNYILDNGLESDGSYSDLKYFDGGDYTCMIIYDSQDKSFVFTMSYQGNDMVVLKNVKKGNKNPEFLGRYYSTNSKYYTSTGYIDTVTFSSTPYIYDYSTTASYYLKDSLKTNQELAVEIMLMYIGQMIEGYDIGISLEDLGFKDF